MVSECGVAVDARYWLDPRIDIDDLDPGKASTRNGWLTRNDGHDLICPQRCPEATWAPRTVADGHTDRRLVTRQAEDPDLHVASGNEAPDRGEGEIRRAMPGSLRLGTRVVGSQPAT